MLLSYITINFFFSCTQDRYVFENFQTDDGDYLTAKFRAFKFPESNYLMFKGTVDVCLDKCQGVSNKICPFFVKNA